MARTTDCVHLVTEDSVRLFLEACAAGAEWPLYGLPFADQFEAARQLAALLEAARTAASDVTT
jgi:hypothetical protein